MKVATTGIKPAVALDEDRIRKVAEALNGKLLWLPWRYVMRDGRKTKIAFTLRGEYASTTEYGTWEKFETALAAYQNGGYSGLGVLMGAPFVALDMDHCRRPETGELTAEAQALVERLPGAYIETSPSGTGLRFLLYCPGFKRDLSRWYENHNGLEVYAAGCTHFVTLTGNAIQPATLTYNHTQELIAILNEFMLKPETAPKVNSPVPDGLSLGGPALSDDALLNKADSNPKNGSKFHFLYYVEDGWQKCGYTSQSAADQALACMLAFWCGPDAERIERLFSGSALAVREKWDRPDYRKRTIDFALEHTTTFYTLGLRPETLTDTGNGALFAKLYADSLRYTPALGWMEWNGTYWESVEESRVVALASEMLNQMLAEARQELDAAKAAGDETKEKAAEALRKHALKSLDGKHAETCVARALPRLSCKADDFDNNPFDLSTPLGIVDLKTGNMRPAMPSDMCTKCTACAPGTMGYEKWSAFLFQFSGYNPSMIEYLQLIIGSATIGAIFEEKLYILNGNGANGKSTFTAAIRGALKDYAGTISPKVFLKFESPRFEAAKLRGRRFVSCSELEQNATLASEPLKQLTSTGKLEIEEKYKAPESVSPTAHIFMETNYPPKAPYSDRGTWRRLQLIPLETVFDDAQAIRGYGEILAKECGPAILQWLIDGAIAFYKAGCKIPPDKIPEAVTRALEEYRGEEDPLQSFLKSCTEEKQGNRVKQMDVYNRYSDWCCQNYEQTISIRNFRAALKAARVKIVNHSGAWVCCDIALKDSNTTNPAALYTVATQ